MPGWRLAGMQQAAPGQEHTILGRADRDNRAAEPVVSQDPIGGRRRLPAGARAFDLPDSSLRLSDQIVGGGLRDPLAPVGFHPLDEGAELP